MSATADANPLGTVPETPRVGAVGLGQSVPRPDAAAKVRGEFEFSSDLSVDDSLFGATLRSPHPHAEIASIDVSAAAAIDGVAAVITADDVPGSSTYGLITADQPVFAATKVTYTGQPVAAVAASSREVAHRALDAIVVTYVEREPVLNPEDVVAAAERATEKNDQGRGHHRHLHDDDRARGGDVFRHLRLVHGDEAASGSIEVEGTYEIGTQDQAFLGLEAAVAMPSGDGGVELRTATQWLHEDRRQIAACLDLDESRVHIELGGVGGAFGGREDISLQIHVCLLALACGQPVRMHYHRGESFLGHVHRHPATIWMRHHATDRGELVKVEARLVFDGGAFASTSEAVLGNAVTHAVGPYVCPHAVVDGWVVRTNRPPCGAMRGFGVVQVAFAHESQMDKLAEAIGLDPVELRLRNALTTGKPLATGQLLDSVAPVRECLEAVRDLPMPITPVNGARDPRELPGGTGLTTAGAHVSRGVGYGVSIKNLMYSEGADDYSTARVAVADGVATVYVAAAEVGQGFVTLAHQIAASALGVADVRVAAADTDVGSAGSTSASRQTWMSGAAVNAACEAVREQMIADIAQRCAVPIGRLRIEQGVVYDADRRIGDVAECTAGQSYDHTCQYRHRPTTGLDERGQGNCQTAWAFAAHRAVVDVDPDLGLVKVVQVATGQDVGRALNPLAVIGQIEGGVAQGLGLAVMEELVDVGGRIKNPTFTDYLLPTAMDVPPVAVVLIEQREPLSPLGAKGVGEPPTISSTPAIVAAIRDALRRAGREQPLTRVPVRPEHIVGAGADGAGVDRHNDTGPAGKRR